MVHVCVDWEHREHRERQRQDDDCIEVVIKRPRVACLTSSEARTIDPSTGLCDSRSQRQGPGLEALQPATASALHCNSTAFLEGLSCCRTCHAIAAPIQRYILGRFAVGLGDLQMLSALRSGTRTLRSYSQGGWKPSSTCRNWQEHSSLSCCSAILGPCSKHSAMSRTCCPCPNYKSIEREEFHHRTKKHYCLVCSQA